MTRAAVWCKQIGGDVREETLRDDDLFGADEAFLASTTREPVPIVTVNDRAISPDRPRPVTWRLLTAFRSQAEASQRKVQLDQRAAILRRETGDSPAVSLHDLGADEEAETGPGYRADTVCAESPLEDVRPRLRGNADSVIADRHARLGR